MIRLSVKSDYNGLITLWKEAFGDCEEAIRMFLDSRYIADNTVVAEENGRIVSMLFLLEGKLRIKGKLYSSYYLYAAATAKSERGRGIMSELLAFAKQTAFDRGVDFICLKPAEESLYGYYSRFGYKAVFATKTVTIKCSDNRDSDTHISLTESQIDLEKARNSSFSETDAFLWDNSAIDYAIKQHQYYGGELLKSCKGYCLYSADDAKCSVNEFSFTSDCMNRIVSFLSFNNTFSEITVDLPIDYDCLGYDETVRDNGMALAVTESAESVIDNLKNAYLNLTLD